MVIDVTAFGSGINAAQKSDAHRYCVEAHVQLNDAGQSNGIFEGQGHFEK
ncbi:MAG TPA: hypothetical protein VNU46_04010 [Gemmatimonadaceae bacterium]|jgi:hypothetical protein|nr:hypothetical protein [Gemmatimonadaceae bacterium]